jgi:hypothetical protein
MLMRVLDSRSQVGAVSSPDRQRLVRRNFAGAEAFLDLQRTHGNAFVQRLVQRKLAVSRGREGYEQVADRVADAVVRRKDASISIPAIARSAEPGVQRMCTECEEEMQRGSPSITGVIARQPKPSPPPDPGWSDAPKKGLNEWVTTVDEKGNIVTGKAASKGVWRVPVEGLSRGFQKGDKGPAFESPGGKAVALIPNTVNPTAPEKEKKVPVDVLLHLHGHGVGYRELEPGKSESLKVLKAGQLRDVELYQMEQQLLSHVSASKRLIIAVLPQGSERSGFGDLRSNSDAYLTEVFAKLVPKYLPNGAIPGRVIVSGHSGGGPTAMAIAAKSGKRTDVLLFDAINFGCEKEEKKVDGKTVTDKNEKPVMVCKSPTVCASNEYGTARQWVTKKIDADRKNLDGKTEAQQITELKTNGTRFRGYTSQSLANKDTCSYGFWYNKLKTDIETTIKKLKVSEAVANQLRQNYQVQEAKGLTGFKGNEPHERVMGQGNLEAALKD